MRAWIGLDRSLIEAAEDLGVYTAKGVFAGYYSLSAQRVIDRRVLPCIYPRAGRVFVNSRSFARGIGGPLMIGKVLFEEFL